MRFFSNVIARFSVTQGLLFGSLGVLAFSFTFPGTRVAVGGLDATFVGLGRALVSALLAALLLAYKRERPPERRYWGRLGLVAVGVVVGFPLFSALALRGLSSAHGAVIVGLLPATTAVMAVLRAGERPSGVEVRKLRDYCLSPEHPRGRHKARVFAAALGLAAEDSEELRRVLLSAAVSEEATPAEEDGYGQRYMLDFEMSTGAGSAAVRSGWIVRSDEDFPRFTGCWVL